jgi:COP9 signalosome complex subunit 4
VTKAGGVVENIQNPEKHMALILRYKSTYARVLDANRKFLQAASRYHDLSQSSEDLIRAEDLLGMLGRGATCAILAPSGPQRQRVLGHVSLLEALAALALCFLSHIIMLSIVRFTKMNAFPN